MPDKAQVAKIIREAFHETSHPGDAFLQGSMEGCEPGEAVAPFKGLAGWQDADPSTLDSSYTALSFFSEGAFRYFLPAFLIADLEERLQTADPVFHLTHGFSDNVVKLPIGERVYEKTIGRSEFVNPRRYGAITWQDYARCRLSVFTREEARAIVAYLEYKRDTDSRGLNAGDINVALDTFWLKRAAHAPEQKALRESLKAEEQYIRAIQEDK